MARRRGHTKEQILAALRDAEGGTTVEDVCRQIGISEQTFDVWKRTNAGLRLSKVRPWKLALEKTLTSALRESPSVVHLKQTIFT